MITRKDLEYAAKACGIKGEYDAHWHEPTTDDIIDAGRIGEAMPKGQWLAVPVEDEK
jgi:hypothetical protein